MDLIKTKGRGSEASRGVSYRNDGDRLAERKNGGGQVGGSLQRVDKRSLNR